MLDKLIDVILEFIDDIKPFVIIVQYNRALMFRFGRTHKILEPGFHWKIPFADQVNEETVVTTTARVPVQSFITRDGVEVATKAIIKYNIDDVKKYIENVYDAADGIIDLTQSNIISVVNARAWADCADVDALSNKISIEVRREVKKYGIAIEQITLTDLVRTPSFRMFTDGGDL